MLTYFCSINLIIIIIFFFFFKKKKEKVNLDSWSHSGHKLQSLEGKFCEWPIQPFPSCSLNALFLYTAGLNILFLVLMVYESYHSTLIFQASDDINTYITDV